jgi:hypothetical protein
MRFENFSFGSICINGNEYAHDMVLDRDEIRKRKKKASKKFGEEFGHTPLSIEGGHTLEVQPARDRHGGGSSY